MDWNGDGKHDWQDDAIFHNVIDTDNNTSSNNSSGRGGSYSSGGSSFHVSQLGNILQTTRHYHGILPFHKA